MVINETFPPFHGSHFPQPSFAGPVAHFARTDASQLIFAFRGCHSILSRKTLGSTTLPLVTEQSSIDDRRTLFLSQVSVLHSS